MTGAVLTVTELTKLIKQNLEENFSSVSLIGEISNFKAHTSGHWYFTLKDSGAQISCTMWRGMNDSVFFSPQDGMKVRIGGKLTVYPPRGSYQVEVRSMQPAGIGELQLAFEKLKEKLFREGLFDSENKKSLPEMPMKIGIATASGGAALKDMISVAQRRFPLVEICVAPCSVQGAGAAETIVKALQNLNERNDIEVIILARGGGSLEDLWAFNEEEVAYAIFRSEIPIVTGIGHEVDFTIADFVADYRAATPTAAMEILTLDKEDIIYSITELDTRVTEGLNESLNEKRDRILSILNSYAFRSSSDVVKLFSQRVDGVVYRIQNGMHNLLEERKNKIALHMTRLLANDVQKTLRKGFVLVKQEDKFVTRAKKFQMNKNHQLIFYDNQIDVHSGHEEKK